MATVILLVIVGVVLLTVLGFAAVRSVRSRRGGGSRSSPSTASDRA